MEYLEYKGYKGTIEYSETDKCWHGHVIGMSEDLITYEGDNTDEMRADFIAGIDDYIEGCKAEGIKPRKPCNGRLTVNLSPDEHSRIATMARRSGKSVSAYIRQALALL